MAKRLGWQAADADCTKEEEEEEDADMEGGREGGAVRMPELGDEEVTAVVEAVLPLAHQCLYNKRPSVISAGETVLKTLACLRPSLVAKFTLPLLSQALDPSSLTTTHQTPASLKALAVVAKPLLLTPRPVLLPFLPTLLNWSLPGLDSNDIHKTSATVAFYIALLDWLPLLPSLPPSLPPRDPAAFSKRLLFLGGGEEGRQEGEEEAWEEAVAEVVPVLGEWALAVVEKCLGMMMDKEGGAGSGSTEGGKKNVLGRIEAATSLVWRLLFRSLFTQMDHGLHLLARQRGGSVAPSSFPSSFPPHVQIATSLPSSLPPYPPSVHAFFLENTLPDAVKDASYLCECLAMASPTATLLLFLGPPGDTGEGRGGGRGDRLLPSSQAEMEAMAPRTLAWRTRLMAGMVRFSGPALLPYLLPYLPEGGGKVDGGGRMSLPSLLSYTLEHSDKAVRKAGGKLFRRALQALLEIYPTDYHSYPPSIPPSSCSSSSSLPPFFLSPPSSSDDLSPAFHVPVCEEITAARLLLQMFALPAVDALSSSASGLFTPPSLPSSSSSSTSSSFSSRELEESWRYKLKILQHAIRGSLPLLPSLPAGEDDMAVHHGALLLFQTAAANPATAAFLASLRPSLAQALHALLPALTSPSSPLHRDVKALKTWCKISSLLLNSVGSSRAEEAPANRQGTYMPSFPLSLPLARPPSVPLSVAPSPPSLLPPSLLPFLLFSLPPPFQP